METTDVQHRVSVVQILAIIEKFIKEGELVDGIIPVNYRNIEDTKQ